MRKAFLFFLIYISLGADAQEIFCNVQVNSSQIQTSDRKVFQTLQTAIYEFVNNTKWTSASIKNEERILVSRAYEQVVRGVDRVPVEQFGPVHPLE